MSNDNEFMTLCGQAFLSGETIFEIATALEISGDYARQLRDGKHKISAPVRAKLDALIAAKDNEPSPTSTAYREQFQEHMGMFKIVRVVAMTHDHAIARAICDMLNKEGD